MLQELGLGTGLRLLGSRFEGLATQYSATAKYLGRVPRLGPVQGQVLLLWRQQHQSHLRHQRCRPLGAMACLKPLPLASMLTYESTSQGVHVYIGLCVLSNEPYRLALAVVSPLPRISGLAACSTARKVLSRVLSWPSSPCVL